MAVRSARSAANFKKYQQTAHLYPNLEYMESSAAHQREDHLEWVGTILPIDHPWWDKHMPPSEWGCECSVRNTDKPVTPVPTDDVPVPPVFDNNPGKTAEIVNLKEHPYVKGVCPYFSTCQRRRTDDVYIASKNPGGPSVKLSDSENPPIIPQCGICKIAAKSVEPASPMVKSREEVKKWSDQVIKPGVPLIIRVNAKHIKEITLTKSLIKVILSKGHSNPVQRNKSVTNFKSLMNKSEYYGWAEDEIVNGKKKHIDTDLWLYYKAKIGYICVKQTVDKLYKPYAIVDEEDFLNIKGVKKGEDPIR